MPSTYAHNAIGGETEETEKVDRTEIKEKTGKTGKTTDEGDRTSEKVGKTTDRQVKERARLEMFLRYRLCLLA